MKVCVARQEIGTFTTRVSTMSVTARAGAGVGAGAGSTTLPASHRVISTFAPINPDSEYQGIDLLSEELEGYSITPTTFEARSYDSSLNDATYVDQYKFNTTSVYRFGINVFADTLRPTKDVANHHGSRASSYSNKSGPKLIKAVKSIKHEDVEIEVLQQGINHLFSSPEICSVLVDIIARSGEGLSVDRRGVFETHTVVLYKNPANAAGQHSITVIDPSNFAYSAHLGNPDIIGDATEHSAPKVAHTLFARSEDGLPMIVIIPNAKVKIYQPKKATGLMHEQYRDCVDVAVKLALGFDVAEEASIVSVDELTANVVVQSIANTAIDTHYPTRIKCPVRIKQASDPQIVKLLHDFEVMHTVTKSATALKVEGGQVAVARMYEEFLGRDLPYDKHLEEGVEYLSPVVASIHSQFEAYTTEVTPQQIELGGDCCSSSSCIIL